MMKGEGNKDMQICTHIGHHHTKAEDNQSAGVREHGKNSRSKAPIAGATNMRGK